MYQLTEAGRSGSVGRSSAGHGGAEKWTLAREQIDFIRRLFDSRVAAKFRAGQREDISFFDACGFWGISAASNAKDLWSRFAEIETILEPQMSLSLHAMLSVSGTVQNSLPLRT